MCLSLANCGSLAETSQVSPDYVSANVAPNEFKVDSGLFDDMWSNFVVSGDTLQISTAVVENSA